MTKAQAKAKAVSWKSLQHAQGPAARIPSQVTELGNENWAIRARALGLLQSTLVGKGQWFPASAPAVGLLLDSLAKVKEPHRVLLLVADIAGADHAAAWPSPCDPPSHPDAIAVHTAIAEREGLLLDALGDAHDALRSAATIVVAMVPALRDEALPRLEHLFSSDPHDTVRASALLAMGRVAQGDRLAKILGQARNAESALVRGASALVALRQQASPDIATETAGLQEWLAWEQPRIPVPTESLHGSSGELPWFVFFGRWFQKVPFPDQTARGIAFLLSAGGVRAAAGVDWALDVARQSEIGRVSMQAMKIALHLSGFVSPGEAPDGVKPPSELSAEQRRLAERIAPTSLLPAGGLGIPASGACRRRWLGTEPGGPLDRVVAIGGDEAPLWQAIARRVFEDPEAALPREVDPLLRGRERWEVLVQFAAWTYLTVRNTPAEALEAEIASLPKAGPELLAWVAPLADDLAERYSAGLRVGAPVPQSYPLSMLLLLPLVRVGIAIEPRWDSLVYVGTWPEPAFEVLKSLPEARREGIFYSRLASAHVWLSPAPAGQILSVLELGPSRRVADLMLRYAESIRAQVPATSDQIVTKLRELHAKRPDLAIL